MKADLAMNARLIRKGSALKYAIILAVALFYLGSKDAAAQVNVSITGGSITGVYYRAASLICDFLNARDASAYSCQSRTGLGSVFNVNALSRDLITFGLVQADVNAHAWNGEGRWQDEPVKSLRSLFSLHDEVVHLIVRADTRMQSPKEIRGKKINIGNLSSGQRENALEVLKLYNLDPRSDFESYSYQQADTFRLYEDGQLDGFFYTVGVPSEAIETVLKNTPSVFLSLEHPKMTSYFAGKSYIREINIPRGTYFNQENDVPTLALKATLMTSSKVPDDLVYSLVRAVFENLDILKAAHPAFRELDPQGMLTGLTAPLHPGALKYYQERGWK